MKKDHGFHKFTLRVNLYEVKFRTVNHQIHSHFHVPIIAKDKCIGPPGW